jgi:DNA mismatch endonuclease (patch repair protein)
MKANRRRDTQPELRLRSALHNRGLRYRCDLRVDVPALRVRPDIVFTRQRVAVFVDGCYWHGCPEHGSTPTRNGDYWRAKIVANQARDERVAAGLEAAGWHVVRIWEHDDMDKAAERIAAIVALRQQQARRMRR